MATSTLPALSRPSTASESASGKQLSRTASFVGMKQQQQGQQRPRSRGELTEVYDLEQTASYRDTVVFNPWVEGKRGPTRGPDFDDDGYHYMLCVEPAVARDRGPVALAAGESWAGKQTITIRAA